MSDTIAGRVVSFDAAAGLGEVERDDGVRFPFHCIEIADGTRTIAVGTAVQFDVAVQARPLRGRAASRRMTRSTNARPSHRQRHPLAPRGRSRHLWRHCRRRRLSEAQPTGRPHLGHHRRRPAVVACRQLGWSPGARPRTRTDRRCSNREGVHGRATARCARAKVGRFSRPSRNRRVLDLHERQPNVRQRRDQGLGVRARGDCQAPRPGSRQRRSPAQLRPATAARTQGGWRPARTAPSRGWKRPVRREFPPGGRGPR